MTNTKTPFARKIRRLSRKAPVRIVALALAVLLVMNVSSILTTMSVFAQTQEGYAVIGIEMNGKTSVVEYRAEDDCSLVVAIYDENGMKMLGSGNTTVTADKKSAEVEISIDEMPQYYVAKGFLVNSEDNNPLCESYTNAVVPPEVYTLDGDNIAYEPEESVYYVNNIIIIVFNEDTEQSEIDSIIGSINGTVVGKNKYIKQYQVEIATHTLDELRDIITQIESNECVLFAHYDEFIEEPTSSISLDDPWAGDVDNADWNDSDIDGSNWWLEAIDVPGAWEYNDRFSKIKIGIIDNGFDTEHEDLDISFPNGKKGINDIQDHGTHVAGIIGAKQNNGKGISGIVQNKELLCFDYLPNTFQQHVIYAFDGAIDWDTEKAYTRTVFIYKGFVELVESGAKVINCSFGMSGNYPNGITYSKSEIDEQGKIASGYMESLLRNHDFIVVKTAGNGGVDAINDGFVASITSENCVPYGTGRASKQGILDRILIVGGVQNNGVSSVFSCGGNQVNIAAPGGDGSQTNDGDIYSTISTKQGSYGNMPGTSMAAPMVTGVAALVWSVDPSLSGADVADIVKTKYAKKAADNPESTQTGGTPPIVNAKLAVEEAIRRKDGTNNNDPQEDEWNLRLNIRDKESSNPVPGASVIFYLQDDTSPFKTVISDSNGLVSVYLPCMDFRIVVDAEGMGYGKKEIVETVTTSPKTVNIDLNLNDQGNIIETGKCGDNITYTLYESGLLELNGSGEMNSSPWNSKNGNKIVYIRFIGNITSIKKNAFEYCDNLKSVNIPNSVTSIGRYAFHSCDNLLSVIIPNTVTSINESTFESCDSLASVTIPNSVTSIGDDAFRWCSSLTSITIPDSVSSIEAGAFLGSGLNSVTIPKSISYIPPEAFLGCQSLTTVVFPKSLTEIGSSAFKNCNIINYNYLGAKDDWKKVRSVSIGALNNKVIHCNNGDISIIASRVCGLNCEYRLYDDGDLIIHGSGKMANGEDVSKWYGNKADVKRVRFQGNVTSICNLAFCDCINLKDIIIPNTITEIGDGAFWDCNSLKNIIIPDSFIEIGDGAFWECGGLTSITIPRTVTSIGYHAFAHCDNLTDVFYTGSEEDWSGITIYDLGNDPINNATIHYNSTGPSSSPTPMRSPDASGALSATFANLTPNANYLFVVSKSSDLGNMLNASNLLYIDEKTAGSDGKLIFSYIPRENYNGAVVKLFGPDNSSVKLDKGSASLKKGEKLTLKATFTPSGSNTSVTWTSSDTAVAKVSGGTVTAVGVGRATITAQIGTKKATCSVTVVPNAPYNVKATTQSSTTVKLNWTADSDVQFVEVWRTHKANAVQAEYVQLGIYYANAGTSMSRALTPGKKYYYKFRGYSYDSNKKRVYSGYSAIVTATAKPLQAPFNVKATRASSTSVKLQWTADPDVQFVEVWRTHKANAVQAEYVQLGIYYANAGTSMSRKLTTGKTYYYKLRGYRYDSNKKKVYSGYSTIVKATP